MLRRILAPMVLLAGVGAADARTTFLTGEFLVNTHTTNAQLYPSVAVSADGSFVVVWTSLEQEGGFQTGAGILARRFDAAANAVASEFLVNTYTTNSQFLPAIAQRDDGELVVVRTSFAQCGNNIFGQWLDPFGVRRGPEFHLDVTSTGYFEPAVAVRADGRALVVYRRRIIPESEGGSEIFGLFIDENGVTQGEEFQVNTYTGDIQRAPDACARPDGQFVVVWESAYSFEKPGTQDGSGSGVFGQIVSSTGQPLGAEFQVNSLTTYAQFGPSIVCTESDEFTVARSGFDPPRPNGVEGVFVRRFSDLAVPAGTEILVNPRVELPQTVYTSPPPSIAKRESGGFVVVWSDYVVASGAYRIVGRMLAESGLPSGDEFVVSSSVEGTSYDPDVAGNHDSFVVTWTNAPGFEQPPHASEDGDGAGVFARKLTLFPDCGDANDNGSLTSSDALMALHTAIELSSCDDCVCDVDNSGSTTTTDALSILQLGVGLSHELTCVECALP